MMKEPMYWKITPHYNNDADETIMPADSNRQHLDALEYAKERLESLWDQAKPGETIVVTMALVDGDLPDDLIE